MNLNEPWLKSVLSNLPFISYFNFTFSAQLLLNRAAESRKIMSTHAVLERNAFVTTLHKEIARIDGIAAVEPLSPGKDLGITIAARSRGVDLISFAGENGSFIDNALQQFGAVLFRGFAMGAESELERLIDTISTGALEYRERTTPRSRLTGNIYTSTDYPPSQSIFPHNENSYSLVFPLKVFFFCMLPARTGGETPIVDCRRVYQRIRPEVKKRFIEKGWMYVRNLGEGFGLHWKTVFQTDDRSEVEEQCRSRQINFEWRSSDCLRTWQVRPSVARHPKTGDPVWMNHATFFHVSTLPAVAREFLISEFGEDGLPNNTYYGDGSVIEPAVLDELRSAYQKETVIFPWQQSDVLVVDNMLTAHARQPFTGTRKVVVGMSEPVSWEHVQLKISDLL